MRLITTPKHEKEIASTILAGGLVVHPTDTIHGVGCDATNAKSVQRVRDAKKRDSKPFSVIAPSKAWISKNCVVTREARAFIEILPGPYTLILKLKNKKSVSRKVNCGKKTLGVRLPRHWFSNIVALTQRPFVTTSANEAGKKPALSLPQLKKFASRNKIDLIVFDKETRGRPSTLIDFTCGRPRVIRR